MDQNEKSRQGGAGFFIITATHKNNSFANSQMCENKYCGEIVSMKIVAKLNLSFCFLCRSLNKKMWNLLKSNCFLVNSNCCLASTKCCFTISFISLDLTSWITSLKNAKPKKKAEIHLNIFCTYLNYYAVYIVNYFFY